MAKLNAVFNGFGTVLNGQFLKKLAAMVLARATLPAVASVSR
jgi:hypothetical protein